MSLRWMGEAPGVALETSAVCSRVSESNAGIRVNLHSQNINSLSLPCSARDRAAMVEIAKEAFYCVKKDIGSPVSPHCDGRTAYACIASSLVSNNSKSRAS
jgi:hypothetical protein